MPIFKIKRSLLCASGNLFALHVLSKMKYLKKHTSIKLLVLFVVLHCVFAASNTKSPKSTREYHNEESSVFVYDNIFGPRLLAVSANMVKKFATWFFVHPDPYEGIEKQDNGDLHWIAPLSPKSFAESKIWKALKKGLEGAGIFEGKKLHPYDVEGTMLLRGFSPAVCKGKGDGDIYMRIFLTRKFKKNDYSELMIYDQNEEVIASIFPKYGRLVVWNDTYDFAFRPPSVNVEQAEYSLLIKATENISKANDYEEKFQKKREEFEKQKNKEFPLKNKSHDDIYKINLAKHLTYNFTDSMKRIVAVFDNVVPKEELDMLRSYFMKSNGAYAYDGYDNEYEESNDNVNWIVKVDPGLILNSRIWNYVHHCASFLSGENQWFPYDVAMNIIQHSHHTRIHADCSANEHEYTYLMYLSPEWNEERYGETIFVEQSNDTRKTRKIGDETYETLSAVIPKYGRIVVFRNIIDHSARPPSPDFPAARYTFAVKVGRSPEIAMAKTLRETLDVHTERSPKAAKLQEEIYDGKYDVSNDPKKEKFLREKLKIYQDLTTKLNNDLKQKTSELLKMKEL